MEDNDKNSEQSAEKIQSLREMIMSAERTIQGAKAMLLQLEGKKKVGRKRKSFDDDDDGKIIEGCQRADLSAKGRRSTYGCQEMSLYDERGVAWVADVATALTPITRPGLAVRHRR